MQTWRVFRNPVKMSPASVVVMASTDSAGLFLRNLNTLSLFAEVSLAHLRVIEQTRRIARKRNQSTLHYVAAIAHV